MMRKAWPIGLLLLAGVALAGCGAPDEMEADESPQSEQESVGEGEVPGPGAALVALAIVGAMIGFAWRRRRG